MHTLTLADSFWTLQRILDVVTTMSSPTLIYIPIRRATMHSSSQKRLNLSFCNDCLPYLKELCVGYSLRSTNVDPRGNCGKWSTVTVYWDSYGGEIHSDKQFNNLEPIVQSLSTLHSTIAQVMRLI